MTSAFIIIAGCCIVFILFVAITWSYDRGFIDGRDSIADDEPADLPPLGSTTPWQRVDDLTP